MTRSRKRKLRRHAQAMAAGLPLASSILGYVPLALAQQPGSIEEIVVTAQKREESLQDVPLSLTALGTEKLEAYNVDSFADYVKFLPSVSFQSFGPGFSTIYMRGVASGENRNHSGPLPSVGVYLDEQPITTITGELDLHIYDIQRVEALSGPQGTLYGASSQAGTIRIITNKPDPSGFAAGYNVEGNIIDGGEAGGSAEGFVNIPINDRVAVRLVGWYQHDGGWIDNVPGTLNYPTSGIADDNSDLVEDNYNPVDTYGGRAALRINLNDSWTVTTSLMGQVQESEGGFSFDPDLGDHKVQRFLPEDSHDHWIQAALTVEGRISNFDVVYTGAMLDRNVDTHLDYSDYSYFYDVLYSYGAYFYDNAGNFINPAQFIIGKDRYEKISHEFRISTDQEKRVRGVAGFFMQRQQHDIEQRYMVDGLTNLFWVTGWPDTIWLTEQVRNDRDYALFGEASVDILPNVTATGGVRYFQSRNSLRGFFGYNANFSGGTGEAACFSPERVNGAPCLNLDKQVEENGLLGKANLTWHVTDDHMVYFTWAEGFRPGGINRRGTLPPYKSDYLTSYEAGWKTAWFGGTLRFNGAVFHSEWDDIQFSHLGANGLTEIKNAGGAEMDGVEISLDWLPTERWSFSGALSWIDAELTENYCGTVGPDGEPETNCAAPEAPKGTSLPVTPEFKANLTARYSFPLGTFDAYVQGSVIYQSDVWADLRLQDRAAHGEQDAYALVDFSAGIAKDNYRVVLYVENAFDDIAEGFRFDQCTICGPQTYVIGAQPRTVGIRFGQEF